MGVRHPISAVLIQVSIAVTGFVMTLFKILFLAKVVFGFSPAVAGDTVRVQLEHGTELRKLFLDVLAETQSESTAGIVTIDSRFSTPNEAFTIICNTEILNGLESPSKCELLFDRSKVEAEFTLIQGAVGSAQQLIINSPVLNSVLRKNLNTKPFFASLEIVLVRAFGVERPYPKVRIDCVGHCSLVAIPSQGI